MIVVLLGTIGILNPTRFWDILLILLLIIIIINTLYSSLSFRGDVLSQLIRFSRLHIEVEPVADSVVVVVVVGRGTILEADEVDGLEDIDVIVEVEEDVTQEDIVGDADEDNDDGDDDDKGVMGKGKKDFEMVCRFK